MGICLVITAIIFLVMGDSNFGHDRDLWRDLSTGGAITLVGGGAMVLVSICLIGMSKQDMLVPFIQQKMNLRRLDDPDTLLKQVREAMPPAPPSEEIVIRDVVKVRCSYCKELVDLAAGKCPTCGASL